MNRNPYLPLTETAYYTLVALLEPCHGYKILNKVKELSLGQVHLAPGTLYGALENLEKQGLIHLVEEVDSRKKIFQTGKKGREVLEKERLRLIHMSNLLKVEMGQRVFTEEKELPIKPKEINPKKSKEKSKKKINKKSREEDLFY